MIPRSRHSSTSLALAIAAVWLVGTPSGTLAAETSSAPSGGDTSAQTPAAHAPEAQYLEPLDGDEALGVLGRKVVGPSGEDLGLIADVVVDRDGRPRAAVIDFGGFLGVGSRKIAVDWNLLQFDPAQRGSKVILSLGRRQIQGAPEYRADATSAAMVGPPLVGPSSGDDGK